MNEETVFLPQAESAFIRPGTRLNDTYAIRSLIAAGGMGEVYKGEALGTGDAVAIKVIKAELARDPAALALFRREASALHNLHHEAIVRYFVFSVDPKLGLPYLAMEFVDGVLLSEHLKASPLDTATLSLLLRRLAAGLQAAHDLGIIHRDVSPDNVILPGGNVARAKLIDFGIARAPSEDGTVIGGGFAGKYAYVSPEQLGLHGGEVTPQSDIYSLGLLLACAARGEALDMGGSLVEVIDKRRRVPDLSRIDERIRPVLTAMLQPHPKDRPADMAAVAALLSWDEPRRRRIGPVLATAAGLAAAAVLGGTAALMLPGREPAAPPRVGALPPDGSGRPAQQVRDAPPGDGAAVGPVQAPEAPRAPEPPPQSGPPPKSVITPLPDPGPDPDAAPPTRADPPASAAADPPASAAQVESFMRTYDGGDCFFVTAVSVEPPNVMVDAFGASPRPFMVFDAAFQRGLGIEPQIVLHQLTEAQCPLVAFLARHYPLRDARAAGLAVTSDLLHSGQELTGTVEAGGDRSVELLLVGDDGRVSNLSRSVRRVGDTARFAVRVEGSGAPKPQMLLLLTSQRPLASLRGPGTLRAGPLLRQVGEELDRDPRPAGIAISYFRLGG
ncbi:serine/threonine-protein kinase [Methylobacterium oryzihabitans]|uniref:Serine/threonine protein kinase n=1 Tax=Methylobacterium oryzihabitans TaxID=2499852 RepID=A0A437NYF1_9HYPH|nr:serine/threonine-protein kinase [Methylobacterium oryzihabitans]RVU14948.1 serine/threonine protein kinase [Methylobacterium oryzihabitans]